MLAKLFILPLMVALLGFAALSMMVPAVFAAGSRDWDTARVFMYSGAIFAALTAMVALATANRETRQNERSPLLGVFAAYLLLPVVLAVPVWEAVDGITFLDSYFEMISSLTTTGASIFDGEIRPPDAVHLWRALVGWLGGFLMWFMAIAILAPLSLGGFEVLGRAPVPTTTHATVSQIARTADTSLRLRHYAAVLAPIYAGLTLVLWVGLYLFGDPGLVALCHAMSTLATSGISPIQGTTSAQSGLGGEILIAAFLIFALSRRTFTRDSADVGVKHLAQDPELRLGLVLALLVPTLLFLRHWVGAFDETGQGSFQDGLWALWGGFFTVVSFMTTTGFESIGWKTALDWSELKTPGLIFLGLALVGGGVATTAGGVKLLRVHVLYQHTQREVERLVFPSSVGSAQGQNRNSRRQGAFMAWIFFMLFALSIAVVMMALALTGQDFEPAAILTISALSTTGPLASIMGEDSILYSTLGSSAKVILCASMVLGRLETLAIISLLNPEFWRR